MKNRPLFIAGVGNLFLGDDAFGCEVTRRLLERRGQIEHEVEHEVEVHDFGPNVRALAYALAARSAASVQGVTVIVDAVTTGSSPGTLQLFDVGAGDRPDARVLPHHACGLSEALATAQSLGARLTEAYVLGCEASCFAPTFYTAADTDSCMLTPPVEDAARRCVELLCRVIAAPHTSFVALCTRYIDHPNTPGQHHGSPTAATAQSEDIEDMQSCHGTAQKEERERP